MTVKKKSKKYLTTQIDKRWFSMREAEQYTSMSRSTLERRISEGAIHRHKVTGKVILDKRELDLLMIRNKQVS